MIEINYKKTYVYMINKWYNYNGDGIWQKEEKRKELDLVDW